MADCPVNSREDTLEKNESGLRPNFGWPSQGMADKRKRRRSESESLNLSAMVEESRRRSLIAYCLKRKAARESKPYGDELKQAISYAFKAVGNLNGEVDSIGDDEDEGVVNVESDHKTHHEDADTHTVSPSSTQMNNDSDWENFLPENQEGSRTKEPSKPSSSPLSTPQEESTDEDNSTSSLPVFPPPGRRRRLTNQLEYLQNLVEYLQECAFSRPFWKDVRKIDLPNYHEIVKQPMDLMTIKKRLQNRFYYSARECIRDVETLTNNYYLYNCHQSNKRGERILKTAAKLEAYFDKKVEEMPKEEVEYWPLGKPQVTNHQSSEYCIMA